jgi:precorrin-6B C5,15-methyltransferase / cobalt-precorrin-6B C5,C15-methyltransferase
VSAEGQIVVVGIGADGWEGLGEPARAAVLSADEVFGSERQLGLLPEDAPRRRPWPSPLAPAVDELVARNDGNLCVLASGDPMLHGIGATLAARLPADRLTVIPAVSAFALACARLGWAEADVALVSAVARPPEVVARVLQPGRRVVVYASGGDGAANVARVLCERGCGDSRFVVLERLGAPDERITEGPARLWRARWADPLHSVAIEVRPPATGDEQCTLCPLVAGLPDDTYETDGALTKRHVRAATLSALAPTPGALLWDVGAGSGSVAIEWLRSEPTARAIAVEPRQDRAARITRNALALGVPALRVVAGAAPTALTDLERPDATFIGGGLTVEGVVEAAWDALKPGGRLVANAVTLEGEAVLVAERSARGGELVRIEVSHAEPIGGFTAWRPALPIVQWSVRKP